MILLQALAQRRHSAQGLQPKCNDDALAHRVCSNIMPACSKTIPRPPAAKASPASLRVSFTSCCWPLPADRLRHEACPGCPLDVCEGSRRESGALAAQLEGGGQVQKTSLAHATN